MSIEFLVGTALSILGACFALAFQRPALAIDLAESVMRLAGQMLLGVALIGAGHVGTLYATNYAFDHTFDGRITVGDGEPDSEAMRPLVEQADLAVRRVREAHERRTGTLTVALSIVGLVSAASLMLADATRFLARKALEHGPVQPAPRQPAEADDHQAAQQPVAGTPHES